MQEKSIKYHHSLPASPSGVLMTVGIDVGILLGKIEGIEVTGCNDGTLEGITVGVGVGFARLGTLVGKLDGSLVLSAVG